MEINRENYEIYFLDYHEGRLVPGQVAELLIFLEANPEFKDDFETYEDILVAPDTSISFSGKASLKKNNVPGTWPINSSNYETYFIANTEGLLSRQELQVLSTFLEHNPELKADYELYQKSHIQPDLNITFPAKAKLKRTILNTPRFYYYSTGVAASLVLLFSVFMNIGTQPETKLAANKGSSIETTSTVSAKTPILSHAVKTNHAAAKHTMTIKTANNSTALQALEIAEVIAPERVPVTEIRSIPVTEITSRDIVEPKYIFIRQSKDSPATFTNLYDQINLADHMKNDPVLAPVASSPKNVLQSGLKKLGSIFSGKDVPTDRNTVNFWTLADLGISGYNLLTDNDLRLLTQSNDSGRVVSYALKGDEFEFARKRNK